MAQHQRMAEWSEKVIYWGRLYRYRAGWEIASSGHTLRWIRIHQYRHGTLDEDNLYTSCKPIVDGCKTYMTRKVKGKNHKIPAAGLIWNDDPKHYKLYVTQERVPLATPCRTIIQVERFD